MKIFHSTKIKSHRPAAYFVYADGNERRWAAGELPVSLLVQAREDGFTGKPGSLATLRHGSQKILLAGLGKKEEADDNTFRSAAAAIVRHSVDALLPVVQVVPPNASPRSLHALAEGAILGGYCFNTYKSNKSKPASLKQLIFITATKKPANAGAVGRAVNFARDLINRPPSDKRPMVLAKVARTLAGRGVTVRVFGKAQLKRMGANALLGVNRGSAHPPALVHLRYRPKGMAKGSVVFVGKGVTFDSGGLSLKPADGMMTMKYDMAGAAAVFGVFKALPELKPSMEVHGVAVLTENMPGPDAYKPGDVVKAMNGKTIEVLNTDAEGRVILADALVFASRLKTDAVIDVATLTGAATVALGKAYAALMSNTAELEAALRAAGEQAGEKLWPLPLEKTYLDHLQSKVADLKNIGNPGEAGTIVGGLFLQQFVGDKPWAHVDMASVGWNGTGSLLSPPGATGAMVRTFLAYAMGTPKAEK